MKSPLNSIETGASVTSGQQGKHCGAGGMGLISLDPVRCASLVSCFRVTNGSLLSKMNENEAYLVVSRNKC